MVDIKAILAATVAAFALLPPSLTMHHSIDRSHERILPMTLGVLDVGARLCVAGFCELSKVEQIYGQCDLQSGHHRVTAIL
jgi:hypothetical protein